jgi:hypothetical protein
VDGDGHTHDVLERWSATLTQLDSDRAAAASSVEWLAKLSSLRATASATGSSGDARLGLVDLQWADIRPEKGSTTACWPGTACTDRRGRRRIAAAVTEPPSDTRAYFRGRCVSSFGKDVVGASWDSVIFDVPGYGRLQRVPTREPLRGTKALTGGLFARTGGGTVPWGTAGTAPLRHRHKPPQGPFAWHYGHTGCPSGGGLDMKEKTMAGQEQQQPQSRDTEVDEDGPRTAGPAEGQASASPPGR